jgi:hypothetical protein
MERGGKVHPSEPSIFILLGREDVCNEVVPIEEPPRSKNVLNIEYRKLVVGFNGGSSLLLPWRGGRGRGRGRVRKSTWSRHDGGKKARSLHIHL